MISRDLSSTKSCSTVVVFSHNLKFCTTEHLIKECLRERERERQRQRETETETEREREGRETDRQTETKTDRRFDRQTDKGDLKQKERHTETREKPLIKGKVDIPIV